MRPSAAKWPWAVFARMHVAAAPLGVNRCVRRGFLRCLGDYVGKCRSSPWHVRHFRGMRSPIPPLVSDGVDAPLPTASRCAKRARTRCAVRGQWERPWTTLASLVSTFRREACKCMGATVVRRKNAPVARALLAGLVERGSEPVNDIETPTVGIYWAGRGVAAAGGELIHTYCGRGWPILFTQINKYLRINTLPVRNLVSGTTFGEFLRFQVTYTIIFGSHRVMKRCPARCHHRIKFCTIHHGTTWPTIICYIFNDELGQIRFSRSA